MVNPAQIRSRLARLAFVVLAVFWAAAGWFVLLQGGFHTTRRHSTDTTFVSGPGGVFMGVLFLLLAAVSVGIFLQSIGAQRRWWAALVVILFVPPCVFLLRN